MTTHHTTVAAAAAALLTIALAGCGTTTSTSTSSSTTPGPTTVLETPAPPITDRREINRQDNRTAQRRRQESQIMETRPLLDQLPVTVGDVTVSVGGLAADNKTTLIAIDPGEGTDEEALAIYRDLLHAHGDTGHAYKPQVTR